MSFFLPSFAFYFLLYRLNYPGFVTTTRDSIYNFLDNYSGLLAACGQYHLNKEKFAKGGIRMILEKRKIFDGQKDMISTLDLETRARPFDDARVEAQSALRQQPITPAEVLDQAGREVGVAGDGQPRRQEQAIGDHFDGVGKTDAIGANVGLLGGFAHQDTHGIMRHEPRIAFLPHLDRA